MGNGNCAEVTGTIDVAWEPSLPSTPRRSGGHRALEAVTLSSYIPQPWNAELSHLYGQLKQIVETLLEFSRWKYEQGMMQKLTSQHES
jgi:hypothetical protein